MKLSDDVLQVVMRDNDITKEQAEDLWDKTISFTNILIAKYGNTYAKNTNEICRVTKEYQRKLVKKYKNVTTSVEN